MAMAEQEAQQKLMKEWEEAQSKRKMEAERAQHMKEAAERHESMMAQWKMWQMPFPSNTSSRTSCTSSPSRSTDTCSPSPWSSSNSANAQTSPMSSRDTS